MSQTTSNSAQTELRAERAERPARNHEADGRLEITVAAAVAEAIAERLESHLIIQPTLTLADAAAQIGICQETLRLWCDAGKIPHIRVGKFYRIKPKDINVFLEKNYKKA